MERVISITASHRPAYTAEVVESLKNCDNISNYKLIALLEPASEEVINIFKNIDFCDVELNINKKRLGHTLNAYVSLFKGFRNADYVIRLEDDTVVSKDFLKFHEFCSEEFKDHIDSIFSVSAGHYHEPNRIYTEEELNLLNLRSGFSNQGWATWADRWFEKNGCHEIWEYPEIISEDNYIINYKYGGWDTLLQNIHRKNRNEVIPTVSRVLNIGALGGVHHVTPEHHEENIKVRNWAGDFNLKDVLYELAI
jgi:hypothetical protein